MQSAEELLNILLARATANQDLRNNLSTCYEFDFDDSTDEKWYLNLSSPPTLSQVNPGAKCTIRLKTNTLKSILSGNLNPQVAFIKKEIQVQGDTTALLNIIKLWADDPQFRN